MLASSIFDYLKSKKSILKVEKNSNPFKFSYKHNKFSLCLKNIGFAYRTNLDEYRVQIGEKFREQLKSYHLQGYWALILCYHKKSNTYVRNIYEENGKVLTLKHGYPQFYTQILIEKGGREIFMKTVLNDEEGISLISTCKKIEKFDKES